MDIAEVAKRSGLPASTLRYYEEKGLIQSAGRKGLKRLFEPQILDTLELIALGQRAGFRLDEIKEMFTHQGLEIDRQKLLEKADELDLKIKELTRMRDGLRHAAACPSQNHLDCDKFLRILKVAKRYHLRERGKK